MSPSPILLCVLLWMWPCQAADTLGDRVDLGADDGNLELDEEPGLSIENAVFYAEDRTLAITGSGFGVRRLPRVKLAGKPVSLRLFGADRLITDPLLKPVLCDDPVCADTATARVDHEGQLGKHTAIAAAIDGLPVIAYHDITHGALKVARCRDVRCSSVDIYPVDAAGEVGWHTAIDVGPDGRLVISYYDGTRRALKVLRCANPACSFLGDGDG